MHIKFNLCGDCIHQNIGDIVAPNSYSNVNLQEEYANAFRTESYHDFWARLLDLALDHDVTLKSTSIKDCRPPSCSLFVEKLLDPDQPTITTVLADLERDCTPETLLLLKDYYSETANASFLCGLLLKDIERIRCRYRPIKATLSSLISDNNSLLSQQIEVLRSCIDSLTKTPNNFTPLSLSQCKFKAVHSASAYLLKRLESKCKKAKKRLRCLTRLKRALIMLVIVILVSTSVIGACIAMHVVLAFVTLPTLLMASSPMAFSTRWLTRMVNQLDVASKGAYILNRDLDTIGRLMVRLQGEVEHTLALLKLCSEEQPPRILTSEVLRQIWRNDSSFTLQLDELEEHLYLCFMTINKARSLVMKEVSVSFNNRAN